MNDGQYEGLVAELREQSGLLARIADRLAPAAVSGDRGEDYRPVARDMVGEMRSMWVDEIGETHWVLTDAPHEFVAVGRGWRRTYVRRDGR